MMMTKLSQDALINKCVNCCRQSFHKKAKLQNMLLHSSTFVGLDQLAMLRKTMYFGTAQGAQLFVVQCRATAANDACLFLENPAKPAPIYYYYVG
jgi:hypothetical protein